MERIPLLKDSHNHLYIYSSLIDALDISGASDKDEALRLIKGYCKPEEVAVVVGWSTAKFNLTPADLSGMPPVIICNSTLHGFITNDKAAHLVRDYNEEMPEKLDDPFWVEKHLPEVMGFVSSVTGFRSERVEKMNKYMLSLGIYEQEDMYASSGHYMNYIRSSHLNKRVSVWTGIKEYRNLDRDDAETIKGIKLFADGALGTQTAALEKGFLSGNRGVLIWTDDELADLISEAAALRENIAVHTIGDRAVEQVLRVYETLRLKHKPALRMEHCLLIDKVQAERVKDLGITLSMQPNFSKDTVKYRDRLGEDYLSRICPFRMLIDDIGFVPGKDLILGSDGMPQGAKAALNYSLFPPLKSQTLTLEEFVAAYCTDSVEAGFVNVEIDASKSSLNCEVVIK